LEEVGFSDSACPHPHKRSYFLLTKSPCFKRQGLLAFLAKRLISKNGINTVVKRIELMQRKMFT
jgi:hypothetical protein